MSEMIVPDDHESKSVKPNQVKSRRSGGNGGEESSNRSGISTTEDCLRALSQLPGMIAMKVVSTAQANAIRSAYTAILQQHQRSEAGRDQQKLPDDNVLTVLRKNPEMLNMLEPLLTDAQIKMVLAEVKDDTDE